MMLFLKQGGLLDGFSGGFSLKNKAKP